MITRLLFKTQPGILFTFYTLKDTFLACNNINIYICWKDKVQNHSVVTE